MKTMIIRASSCLFEKREIRLCALEYLDPYKIDIREAREKERMLGTGKGRIRPIKCK